MQSHTDGKAGLNGGGVDGHRSGVAATDETGRQVRRSPTTKDNSNGKGVASGRAVRTRGTSARLANTMADAGVVQARLLRAIDRQVRLVDASLTGGATAIEERDARILGHLAKTLETLMAIGEGGRTSKDREPPDRDDAEDRLAERIRRWARGGE